VRSEAKLAGLEISDTAASVARGTALIASGGVLLLLGTLAAFAGLILLIGDQWLPRDMYRLAALLVAAITAALAGLLAHRGRSALRPSALAPSETIETLKEDGEWLKQRMKSAAT
jgi:hypothetical protein